MKVSNFDVAANFAEGKIAESFTGNFRAGYSFVMSYRTMVAQRFEAAGAVLVSCYDYSQTTRRQICDLCSALRRAGLKYFRVPNINPVTAAEYGHNHSYLCNVAAGYEAKAKRARLDYTRAAYLRAANEAAAVAEDYKQTFNL